MLKNTLAKILICLSLFSCGKTTHYPLKVSNINPRYFTGADGKAVYLTGSHTWNNFVDIISQNPSDTFNYQAYLDFLKNYNHNFFRLWNWELLNWDTNANQDKYAKNYSIDPHPWLRTGPGLAVDGKPLFDLTKFNEQYFKRLRDRVEAAQKRGYYVSIMIFEGWGMQFSPNAYKNHPFYPMNNLNNMGLDTAESSRLEIYELKNKMVLDIQEKYLKKLIETVNDLDNVLYEISNENHPASTEWQYHMINFIKDYEKGLGNQHPVGMTFQYKGGTNKALFDSPADWISPNPEGGYRDDPPVADGTKVIINDTDHLWGLGGNPGWVWKSFLRGMNVLFMDPYEGSVLMHSFDKEWAESIRKNMGYAAGYAKRMDLLQMVPSKDLSSTEYCLANKGKEYLVYFPKDTTAEIDLSDTHGKLSVEWLDPATGVKSNSGIVEGYSKRLFIPPFHSGSAVLYMKIED